MRNDELAGKPLTKREKEVLQLVVEGETNNQIARALNISYYTAKAHVSIILQKLDVQDRVCAAIKAVKSGIVE